MDIPVATVQVIRRTPTTAYAVYALTSNIKEVAQFLFRNGAELVTFHRADGIEWIDHKGHDRSAAYGTVLVTDPSDLGFIAAMTQPEFEQQYAVQ